MHHHPCHSNNENDAPSFWRTKSGKAPENESSCTSKGTRELACMVFGGREQSLLSGEKSGRVPEIENSNASKATQELTQSVFGARNQN